MLACCQSTTPVSRLRTQSTLPVTNMDSIGTIVWDSLRGRLAIVHAPGLVALADIAASAVDIGTACGSPAAILMPRDVATIGNVDFALDAAVEPFAPCLFGVSSTQANVPIANGCAIQVGALDFSAVAICDARGLARWSVPVPNVPALVGITVFAQAGALTATSGTVTTQGLQILVGN